MLEECQVKPLKGMYMVVVHGGYSTGYRRRGKDRYRPTCEVYTKIGHTTMLQSLQQRVRFQLRLKLKQ